MNRENLFRFKAVIIGGGMAGLVSAINLSLKFGGENILLIEKQNRVGKKILSTGNGQCNISNKNLSIDRFHGENPDFVNYSITNFGLNNLIEFFNNLGVLFVEDDAKIYPMSMQASSVLDALRFKIENLKVKVVTEEKVLDISKTDCFKITTNQNNFYYAENVVLAVGGKSAKHLGSDGSSYALATKFNHTLTKLYPSLVQLKCNMQNLKGLKGLKCKVNLFTQNNNFKSPIFNGDIMFTDYGVSGNAVFSLSPYIIGKPLTRLYVDFCPNMSQEGLVNFLNEKINKCDYLTVEYLLNGILPNKIASRLIANACIDIKNSIKCADVVKIARLIKSYTIEVTGDMGFDNSQVTRGGLLTKEFNDKTMESKLVKGLYAVGEVLDIDGDCGGFNLQWAYSSACTACDNIK